MKKEELLKLLASLKVQAPADATEEQLTALLAKHTTEANAAQAAELARLQAVEAKAAADKKTHDEVLAAKQKELDAAKAEAVTAAAAKPGIVVVAPGVDSNSRPSVTPNAFDAIRAMQKEPDSRKRGQIYCSSIRKFVSENKNVAEILAANSLGSVSGEIIVQRALDLLKLSFPVLSRITTDFTSEQVKWNQEINSRIVSVPTVGTYSTSTGYGLSDVTTTDVPVTINAHKHITIGFHAQELGATGRDLFSEQAEAMNYALGKNLVDALYALFVIATYTNATTVATASLTRITGPLAIASALNARGVSPFNRTLLLSSAAFLKLGEDSAIVNLASQQRASLIEEFQLPKIAGLQPIEAVNLPSTGNMTGFAMTPDAAVIATRLPKDYTTALPGASHGSVSVVTNPDTGISVLKTDFVDHTLGGAYSRIAWMYGVAAGNPLSGQIIKSA